MKNFLMPIEEEIEKMEAKVKRTRKKSVETIAEKSSNNDDAKRNIIITIAVAIVLCSVAFSYYFYNKYNKASVTEADDIVAKIGRLMVLPEGEIPKVATVTDLKKAQEQEFFANAESGDKVLMYAQAKKAYLYRPSINKIVGVGAFNEEQPVEIKKDETQAPAQEIQQPVATENAAPAQEEANAPIEAAKELKISIYNGSAIRGLANVLTDKVTQIGGMSVVEKTNATGNFDKTLVVDISGGNSELVSKVAEAVSGEVADLPAGETAPNADILVIGGEDQK